MISQGRRYCGLILVGLGVFVAPARAEEAQAPSGRPAAAVAPLPYEDDAGLHDVQFVGSEIGWAVGDHGVIWHTRDGGATWRLVPSPVSCPLRSVCFLTDRVGWVAGGGTTPYTRLGYGVVLFTNDGGATWQQLAEGTLPQLVSVRFFDLNEGVAVGEASTDHPTGVFATKDGGKTWQSLPGPMSAGWRTAEFVTPRVGVVAGLRGNLSLVGGGRMLQPRVSDMGLRGLRDVCLQQDETGWMVGDGGLVLHTTNGGVSWESPPTPLPEELADVADFRAVVCRGPNVWIAGRPGSVIWHSPDNGTNWHKQETGQTVPIEALTFTSDTDGWAVGALGTMLRTQDGGRTWQAVRGERRRVAFMTLQARPGRVSFPLLAAQSAEAGHRSFVLLPARRDLGPDGHEWLDADLRLHEAVTAAGGSAGEFGWRLPVGIPGLEHDYDKLIEDWTRRTEGRLGQVLLGDLVCQIRTWRPSVVVVDQPSADDATTRLLNQALLQAVAQAADPTRFVEQTSLGGLPPWQVARVYQRLAPGSTGDAHIDPHQFLPRVGATAQGASAAALHRLVARPPREAQREAYRLIAAPGEAKGGGTLRLNRDFFVGLGLTPGTEARRLLLPLDELAVERGRKLAERQRNFQASVERMADDPRFAQQLLGQLRDVTAGMPDEQGARQLVALAHEHRRRSQWELLELTYVELVERYPQEPASREAMRWLFQWWTGAEPAFQRVQKTQVDRQQLETNVGAVLARLTRADEILQTSGSNQSPVQVDLGPDPVQYVGQGGVLATGGAGDVREARRQEWHDRALQMAGLIRQRDPALYQTPEIQFPLASLLRRRGTYRLSDGFYRRYNRAAESDLWRKAAEMELWLAQPLDVPPREILSCYATSERPHLDGVLSDVCWQNAVEIPLLAEEGVKPEDGNYAFALLAYDNEFLYFAASFPVSPAAPDDMPELPGRTHDADLSRHDRVSLLLDIDRDYATWYEFQIDQRGWTAEACWDDTTWNPKWYVAAAADNRHWRVEAAIPLSALAGQPPSPKAIWAAGIVRTIPAVGLESWTHPAASRPRPETFGLIRFD